MKKLSIGLVAILLLLSGQAWAVTVKVWDDYQEGGKTLVKAEGVVKASPEVVWDSLIRFNDYAQFMPRVIESFFISEDGIEAIQHAGTRNANKLRKIARPYKVPMPRKIGRSWEGMVFMVVDTPFPVENRWYVIKAVQDETRAVEKIYKRCWSLVIGNIDSANGCWRLAPGPQPMETSVRYEDNINPGGKVPRWAANLGTHETVPRIFQNLEKEAMGIRQ